MIHKLSAAAVLGSAILLGGCIVHVDDNYNDRPDWRARQAENIELIQRLELGMPINEVHDRLGPADVSEAFSSAEHEYRILRYRTHHRHSDGTTTDDETTPLLFEDGRLVGWGESSVHRTLRERGFDATQY